MSTNDASVDSKVPTWKTTKFIQRSDSSGSGLDVTWFGKGLGSKKGRLDKFNK